MAGDGRVTVAGPRGPDDSSTYTAPHICIATGGTPVMPNIPGIEHAISSDGFFELEDLPQKAVVVGSGYIGVELAGILNGLGSDVTLMLRSKEILSHFDESLRPLVQGEAEANGITFVNEAALQSIDRSSNGKLALQYTRHGETITLDDADEVIMAVGRHPLTDIGLDTAGVALDDRGFIQVDRDQNTSADGVYAIGDVVGTAALTPVAIAAGRKLAHRLFEPNPDSRQDYSCIPSVLFSHPPVGTCGLTQAEAEAEYGAEGVVIYTTKFTDMAFALADHRPKTFMKLVCALPDERVVGLHMVGHSCDEILQGFAVAMKMGATKVRTSSFTRFAITHCCIR